MDELSKLQDQELLALFREGEYAAYQVIYKRYWAILFRHARRMLQNDEEAKDAVQDIFTMLWLKGPTLFVNSTLSAFLYSSLRHKIFDIIDRNKVKGDYFNSLESFIDKGELTTDNIIREKELAALIEKEISFLPEKMREVFELSRKSHLSYKEIAEKMNITDNTVKKQINNALKLLRFKLGVIILVSIFLFLK
ncbi:RNA polymerase sigma-70 factor [Pedobacter sp. MR2016-19]|uniref:RNA polymerase sigma factor n=1 Tax=Pedobacter sp. MR2016-19 TaxID=2780089 RepID=UPI001876D40A|nr:RNA polymerase sigma-70 factor [Pedobacter sp. MR2016-19]MBE5321179.1 RNA polymerase sigma-70 factor [Pedobacter sp. MR2016-19]